MKQSHHTTPISRNHFSNFDLAMSMQPTVIIDKNFIQSEDLTTPRLARLARCGCQFIFTDTLIFELCSDNRIREQWTIVQKKLLPFVDQIQVWRHTAELMQAEASENAPVQSPLDSEFTNRLQNQIRKQTFYKPEDFERTIDIARRERETNTASAIPGMARSVGRMLSEYSEQTDWPLRTKSNLGAVALSNCNSEKWIRWAINACFGNETSEAFIADAQNRIDSRWFCFHHARTTLALIGVFLSKYGLNEEPGKKFVNTRHDMDLLALLHYADAIASDETTGDLATALKCLYGGSKSQITSNSLMNNTPTNDEIRIAAYYNWLDSQQHAGDALSDWLRAETTLETEYVLKLFAVH